MVFAAGADNAISSIYCRPCELGEASTESNICEHHKTAYKLFVEWLLMHSMARRRRLDADRVVVTRVVVGSMRAAPAALQLGYSSSF